MTGIGVVYTYSQREIGNALVRELSNQGILVETISLPVAGDTLAKSHDHEIAVEKAVHQTLNFNCDYLLVMCPEVLTLRANRIIAELSAEKIAWIHEGFRGLLPAREFANIYDRLWIDGNPSVVESFQLQYPEQDCTAFHAWSDSREILEVKPSSNLSSVAVFGAFSESVNRKRYYELLDLDLDLKICSSTRDDFSVQSRGEVVLNEELEYISDNCSVALVFSESFQSLEGTAKWHEALTGPGGDHFGPHFIKALALGRPVFVIGETEQEPNSYFDNVFFLEDLQQLKARVAESVNVHCFDAQRFTLPTARAQQVLEILGVEGPGSHAESGGEVTQDDGEAIFRDHLERAVPWHAQEFTAPLDVLFLGDFRAETTRSSAVRRVLERWGHNVSSVGLGVESELLRRDPLKICKYQLDLMKLERRFKLSAFSVILIADFDVALSEDDRKFLADLGIKVAIFDDSQSRWGDHFSRLSRSFDLVSVPMDHSLSMAESLGYENFVMIPHFVNPDYLPFLAQAESRPYVKCRRSLEREFELSPAMGTDGLDLHEDDTHHFLHLKSDSLSVLASKLKSEVAILSHEGHRDYPFEDPMMPYVAVSTELLFFPALRQGISFFPYDQFALQVSEIGELWNKANEVLNDSAYGEKLRRLKRSFDFTFDLGHEYIKRFLGKLVRDSKFAGSAETLKNGEIVATTVVKQPSEKPTASFAIVTTRDAVSFLAPIDLSIEIVESDGYIRRMAFGTDLCFLIPVSQEQVPVTIRVRYLGKDSFMVAGKVFEWEPKIQFNSGVLEGYCKSLGKARTRIVEGELNLVRRSAL